MDLAHLVAASAALTWIMIMTASFLRTRAFTLPGMVKAFGNRDDLAAPSAASERADRAARNMIENLVLFVALAVADGLFGAAGDARVRLGAALFFWARVAYFPVYLAGIRYLRTLIWIVSLAGLGMMLAAAAF
jgi:uncharacterized MAPEG superfamily protein